MRLRHWLIECSPVCHQCDGKGDDIWAENCKQCLGTGRLAPQIFVEDHAGGTLVTLMDRRGKRTTCTREELEAIRHLGDFVTEPFTETVGDTHGA